MTRLTQNLSRPSANVILGFKDGTALRLGYETRGNAVAARDRIKAAIDDGQWHEVHWTDESSERCHVLRGVLDWIDVEEGPPIRE